MAQTLKVTALDEAFLNLDQQGLMSVQFEVRVTGRLDAERLAAALRTAVRAHPLARARLTGDSAGATRLDWHVEHEPDHLSMEITDEDVDVVRARLQSFVPDLKRSPGFAVTLVHDDAGDVLMLNLHHAAFDGMSAVRLVTSIARAYAGTDDPIGGPPLTEARDLGKIAGARGVKDVGVRALKIVEDTVGRRDVTRLAHADGQPDGPHYAFATLRLTAEEAGRAIAAKPSGCTVNDLAIAAHVLSALRWNRERGQRTGSSVSVMMPVNMRPAGWSGEVLSNFASYLAIVVKTADATTLESTTQAVQRSTGPAKANGAAGWIVDVLEPTSMLPRIVRKNLQSLLPLVEQQFVETTVLSNLGRAGLPGFSDAGEVTEIWFSPPSFGNRMPLALGVVGLGRELQLCFRSVRSKIGADALAGYADIYREVLLDQG